MPSQKHKPNGYAGKYHQFLQSKRHKAEQAGFDPVWMPDFLFGFQAHLDDWAIRTGRCSIFAACGLGKTPMQLVWSENVVRKTNGRVLVVTPLAVSPQTVREGEKFGIECKQSREGRLKSKIVVTNYERLHYFRPDDFAGVVADESGAIKDFATKRRKDVTEFMRGVQYRLLCTATPAPNDWVELGTSSEALGLMRRSSMLGTFFTHDGKGTQDWRLRGHASKRRFWEWMGSWARAIRKPSDLGFDDDGFILPELRVRQIETASSGGGRGFGLEQLHSLNEQRVERRRTLLKRCKKVAELVPKDKPFVAWCQLNSEGDMLEEMIPGSVQVAGKHSDDLKEERLNAFSKGEIRVLITKPSIACFGLNWQHCSDIALFPTHSYEQYHQLIHRFHRFGQKRSVNCSIVTTPSESVVLENMQRKERQAEEMFRNLVEYMNSSRADLDNSGNQQEEIPSWLSKIS